MEEGDRELNRFPKGAERCSRCRAKRWYSESGLRFCQNGHQIEGYIEFAADEDGTAGLTNHHTVRKEKEVRELEKQRLTGAKGRDLYLECLQYLLRNQVLWLIKEKQHKPELEVVVRDLWDLRIRGCPPAETTEETQREEFLFSSSQPMQLEEEMNFSSGDRATLSWIVPPGTRWSAPILMETLALCYFGCLLLRIPTKIGDIFMWAKSSQLPFINAMEILPKNLTERLPQPYPKMLKSPARTPILGNDLYAAVTNMTLAYHVNYAMASPAINHYLMALDLVKSLGLPLEVMIIVKQLSAALSLNYSLPVTKARIMLIDQPEVQLVALIMVIVKHFFPFSGPSGVERRPQTLPTIDWNIWKECMKSVDTTQAEIKDYREITGDNLVSMTEAQQDVFLDQILSLSQSDESNNRILSFFPFGKAKPAQDPSHETKNRSAISASVHKKGLTYGATPSKDVVPYFSVSDRTINDLPDDARSFYELVAARSGLDIQTLIRAVDMTETKIQATERNRR